MTFHLVQKHSRSVERSIRLIMHVLQPEDHWGLCTVDCPVEGTTDNVVDLVIPLMQDENVSLKVPCEGIDEWLIRIISFFFLHTENEYFLIKDSEAYVFKLAGVLQCQFEGKSNCVCVPYPPYTN